MTTFRQFADGAAAGTSVVPTATAWSLAELGEAMGIQELFTRQSRVGQMVEPRGAKGDLVRAAVSQFAVPFRLGDIERACPGVSRDFIRLTLRKMNAERRLRSFGRGPAARWERTGE